MKKKSLNKYRPLKLTEHDIARARLIGVNKQYDYYFCCFFFPANRLALIAITYELKIVIILGCLLVFRCVILLVGKWESVLISF